MFYVVTAVYVSFLFFPFLLICSCDAYAIGKVSLEGEMTAENPYKSEEKERKGKKHTQQ